MGKKCESTHNFEPWETGKGSGGVGAKKKVFSTQHDALRTRGEIIYIPNEKSLTTFYRWDKKIYSFENLDFFWVKKLQSC